MKLTVLIIDDNEDDILLTKMVLTKISGKIKVETALNGETGLAFLRDGKSLPPFIDPARPKNVRDGRHRGLAQNTR